MLKVNRLCGLLVILAVVSVVLLGCGTKVNLRDSDSPDDIAPPSTPGALEELVGTSWNFPNHGMLVQFSEPPTARLANPANPSEGGPASWSYRPNGVISVSAMGTTFAGTWDGSSVILSGESGVRESR